MDNTADQGFTLLELIIAMAIAAILVAVGAPSVSEVMKNQKLKSVLGPVSLSTFTARSEAAKSGGNVTVCARQSDEQCGNDWNNGMLVFRDSDIVRDELQAVRDADDEILRVIPAHESGVVLAVMASKDRTANTEYAPFFLRFGPDGRANWKNGTFYACDDRGAQNAVALHITISGDIRPARRPQKGSDTVVKDVFSRPISC